MTVDQALAEARARGLDRLDAHLLLAHALGRTRSWVMVHGEDLLPPAEAVKVADWIARRAADEPLAYLTGEKEFRGLVFRVDKRVLVPRPDSETLVDWALDLLRDAASPGVIDLGTGSGALAAAIAHECPAARVTALDRSEDALAVARGNFGRLDLAVEALASDWWSAVQGRRFDLALSNPPYVAEGDPHLAALAHEPRSALTAGADGLDDIRRLIADAQGCLSPAGWLLMEHGHDQAAAVRALLAAGGFVDVQTRRDMSGIERCSGGRLRVAAPTSA